LKYHPKLKFTNLFTQLAIPYFIEMNIQNSLHFLKMFAPAMNEFFSSLINANEMLVFSNNV